MTTDPDHIQILQSIVVTHADVYVQSRQVADRARDLAAHVRQGYLLASTTSVPGDDHVLYVDTLMRQTTKSRRPKVQDNPHHAHPHHSPSRTNVDGGVASRLRSSPHPAARPHVGGFRRWGVDRR
ncbi:hypothetical protein SRABI128_00389 [Microbacterium sp. Bi128]|nr:hypothetical protein SRABI128_00389 [Microbacterium sp. Bi128]